ncbi:ABC transporter substrate-binding protein [Hydrogenophaga sp. BPS33]|uniref:ABC transporter substrate-binding protein n=1 Tax=Hydrogenophaga sp. BPS33 TaxID=2651974 RepID=UPI001F221FC7|nr:sugar ABC transporter substrate-binding protein [Hydrogenophaga sp. BPS33]
MQRRHFIQASATAIAAQAVAPFAYAQSPEHGLKPGKPYAGKTVNLLLPPASQFRAQEKRLAEFESLTGIKVVYTYVPYGQLLDKITTEAVAGNGAYDLIAYQDSWLAALAGYLEPIDANVKADKLDLARYPKVFSEAAMFEGRNYGLPVRAHPQLYFYRKDLFAQAGAKVPTTWDEMLTATRAVQDKTGVAGVAMDYVKGSGFQNLWLWFNCLWGHGSDVLDAQGKPIFNNAAGVAATQAYVDVLFKHKVANPGSTQFNEYDMVNSMAQGNSASMMVWWWTYSVLTGDRSKLKADQVGFAPMLSIGEKKTPSVAIVMPFGMSKQSRNKEAAWEFLKWVTNPALEAAIVSDKSDANTADIVATHISTFRNEKVNQANFGLHQAALQSLENARTLPKMTVWPQVATVLETAISDIVSSNKAVKPTLDAAARQVEQITQRAGGRRRG